MESVKVANVDISKFLALDKSKPTKSTGDLPCSDFILKMLEEGVHADVTFHAKGGSVAAHKSVLACVSPVFLAMLQHDMKEKITSTVDIPDRTIGALQLFLILLYTTFEDVDFDVPQMPELSVAIDKHFSEFHKAALKYQVEGRLGSELVSALARNLTPHNCRYYYDCSLLARPKAYRINACSVCFEYMLGNYSDVIRTKCFLEEMRCHTDLVRRLIIRAEDRAEREIFLKRISKKNRGRS